jgi:CRP/FNR family cyclic AMP-dependent transcriptional regulator
MARKNPLRNITDFESVAEGDKIFKEGDPGEYMYFVVAGEVRVFVGGKEVDTIGMGGIFGEMALIDDKPRSATMVAKTACKLIPINQRRFTLLVKETPHFAIQVMRIMADRLRHMNKHP